MRIQGQALDLLFYAAFFFTGLAIALFASAAWITIRGYRDYRDCSDDE